MLEQILTGALFLGLVYGLAFTRWHTAWVFSLSMAACYLLGLVETGDILEKASNPGLMTLVMLLLVSVGVEKLGWLTSLARKLVRKGYRQSLMRMGVATALFSAFTNNTAVVATLANAIRSNPHHLASKLLMPLSYMAILGGTMTLIGTSTNLIVSGFVEDATDGAQSLAFFEFLPVGLAAAVVGMAVIVLTSKRLLPARADEVISAEAYLIETEVAADSALVGQSVLDNKLRELETLFLVEIVRDDHLISPVGPQEVVQAGDKLIFSGDIKQLGVLDRFDGLTLFAVDEGLVLQNLTEVIVMPNASVEGKTIKNSSFRSLFDAAVVGLHRGGKRLSGKLGDITLEAGDRLMLAAGPDFFERQNLARNFVVIQDDFKASSLSAAQNYLVTLSLLAVVALASLDIVPLIKGLSAMLVVMLLAGIVRPGELRRRFPFELWLIITSALTWSEALNSSGLVRLVTDSFHSGLSELGPYAAIAGIFLFTLVLTEIMTNNAAAALSFPIAFGLAESYGLNFMPFVMAVAYGASASFLTPYGYTTNLMVQNLGGYEFRDYLRAGLPVSVAYAVTVIYLIPLVFPF